MEYAGPVYRRYYENYEALGIVMTSPWNIGLLTPSEITEWMDRPENKKRSDEKLEQIRQEKEERLERELIGDIAYAFKRRQEAGEYAYS